MVNGNAPLCRLFCEQKHAEPKAMASFHRAPGTKDSRWLNGLQPTIPLERRKSGSLSSTPHAPRSVPTLRINLGLRLRVYWLHTPLVRVRRALPFISAHPLQQHYRLPDAGKAKSKSTTDLQLRVDSTKVCFVHKLRRERWIFWPE